MFQRNSTILFMLLWCAVGAGRAASSSDFLVIGDPAACDLFDQYEQPLSVARKKALPLNMPFQIVNERQTMGDQITQATRLSHLASTYYLLLDDKGRPAGIPSASSAVRYKGCKPLYDTVIIASPSVTLFSRYPAERSIGVIKNGEKAIRIFHWRDAFFIYRPGAAPLFGWFKALSGSFRALEKKAVSATADFSLLHERIMKRLADANERYDSLFLFFNTVSGRQKAVPRWDYSTKGNQHVYALRGPEATVRQLEASTRHIIADIEYILLGKPYAVLYRAGTITITPR